MNGAELLVRELQSRGVSFVSVLCGNGLDSFLMAASKAGLRVVDTRNEQAASYIAETYARLTGRVGVCAVSSGVAHVNAFAGLLNAYYDGAPVLLITGASHSVTLGRGGFQDLDQVALARPLCKFAELVTGVRRIPSAVREAFAAATTGRPGPVHLTIPADVLAADAGEIEAQCSRPVRTRVANVCPGDEALVRDAARAIAEASRPIIVAGTGVFYAGGGEALIRFAQLAGIPIVTPIWDRGVVDKPCAQFLGVVGAASGEPKLLEDADLIVLAGAAVDYRVRCLDSPPLAKGVKVVRIDADSGQLHRGAEPDIAILGDPRTVFEQLRQCYAADRLAGHGQWLAEAQQRHRQFYSRWVSAPRSTGRPLTGAHIVHSLRGVISDETIFLIDGGNIGQWAHMVLCSDRYPSNWPTCGASAVVGWGFPGAMGARLAFPDRPVLLLSGDGAAGFGLPELESSVRQKLPFVAVVADDRAWGIVVTGQRRWKGVSVASELGGTDYARVAEGFGARGVRAETMDEIARAVKDGFASGRTTLVHVPIRIAGPSELDTEDA